MTAELRFERLSIQNFSDFESLTCCEPHGACYCSFWHQKWAAVADWETCKKETPDYNRSIVLEKVKANFHVGVLAYLDKELLAWLSVGPVTDFYWTWRRVAQLGEDAPTVAGILCITLAEKFRGLGRQKDLLVGLKTYGLSQGWKTLEGYPFDPAAVEKHGSQVHWPGLTPGFLGAGFQRIGPHWLSKEGAERSIFATGLA